MKTTKQTVMQIAHKKFNMLKAQYQLIKLSSLPALRSSCLKWAWKMSKVETMVNLWINGVQDKILKGSIKLVQGQPVLCGNRDHPSLFVSHNGVTLHVVHWQGSEKATVDKFNYSVKMHNKQVRFNRLKVV